MSPLRARYDAWCKQLVYRENAQGELVLVFPNTRLSVIEIGKALLEHETTIDELIEQHPGLRAEDFEFAEAYVTTERR